MKGADRYDRFRTKAGFEKRMGYRKEKRGTIFRGAEREKGQRTESDAGGKGAGKAAGDAGRGFQQGLYAGFSQRDRCH